MDSSKQKTYLLAGGSGMVGRALQQYLKTLGHKAYVLSTNEKKCDQETTYYWNPSTQTIHLPSDIAFDAVVNLAGANIADKLWTDHRKKELAESRVLSTQFIGSLITSGHINTAHLVQLSAVGFYGDRGNNWCDETSSKGSGYLSDLTAMWEKSCTTPASILRLGIVFDPVEGAYPKIIGSIRFGVAAIFGSGNQYLSWISVKDLCRMILFCADHRLIGVYNAVSSRPITYAECIQKYSLSHHKKPLKFSIPKWLFKWITKDFYELFYFSQRVSNKKITERGFTFEIENPDHLVGTKNN